MGGIKAHYQYEYFICALYFFVDIIRMLINIIQYAEFYRPS